MSENPLQQAVARARENNERVDQARSLVGPLGLEHIRYTETRTVALDSTRLVANGLVAAGAEGPESRVFSALAQQVLQKMRENGFRSVAVVAPTAGTGCSLIAANLSIALAKDPNQTVVAVDLDVQEPTFARLFGADVRRGLVDHLVDGTPIPNVLFHPGAVKRLVVLPNRARQVNAQEVYGSWAMTQLLGELRDRYDARLSVFDVPPLLDSGYGLALLQRIDCALLVVRQGFVTRDEIDETKRLLAGVPMIGVVLNDVEVLQRASARR
ncbi:MAG: CpsD/CapB family tyrosine-protein kinase [Pseudomonadales bacterium]|nr:CpsD/CapB family tyrosine-protein kinase [Pseudomonadales bacterium]